MRPRTTILIIIVAVVVIASLNFLRVGSISPAGHIKNFFYVLSSPIQKLLWGVGDSTSDFFAGLFNAQYFYKETQELQRKNLELLAGSSAAQAVKEENRTLRGALNIGLEKEFDLAFASVVGQDIGQDFILIDKGFIHGIQKNQPVVSKEKFLCGRISETYKKFSKVELTSSKDFSCDARIAPGSADRDSVERSVAGVVKGRGNFRTFIGFIPREAEIEEGELVITTPSAGIFPANLLIGTIKRLLRSDVEPFQQADIESACDIREIEHLFIIREY